MTLRNEEPPYDDEEPRPRLAAVRDEPGNSNVPHQNPPAEMAVLGAILTYPELAQTLAPELAGDDFYRPAHETIWDTIQAIAATGALPDPVTVGSYLNRQGDLTRIGGVLYLHDLMQACPVPAQAPAYAKDVRDASRRRAIATAGTKLRQIANGDDIETALQRAVTELNQAALRFGPTTTIGAPTGRKDLSWLKTGIWPVIDPPTYGRRTDGNALFYAGRVNGIFGDPEAAKTWLAQMACIEAMKAGRFAAIIDVDHNGQELNAARMGLLGARPEELWNEDLFGYYEPEDASELRAAIAQICTLNPAVVVLDSIGEMLPMMGVKSVDNDEITEALRAVASPPARAGACVITIDHLPKSHEARATGFAIGGTAKKRAIDGSYIHAQTIIQPAPNIIGKVNLLIEKDRPGELRKTCSGKYVGQFILDSTAEHATRATIGVASSALTDDGVFRPTHLMEAVSRFVEDMPDCNASSIEKQIHSAPKHVRAAVARLLEEGYLETSKGPRNSTLHTSAKPFREAADELF